MCSSSSTTTSRPSRASSKLAPIALISLSGALVGACGGTRLPAPKGPTEAALFHDLERQVSVASAIGWGPDKLEIEGIVKATLDSTCRVHPLARRSLATWLDDELRLRGTPEAAWRAHGKDLSKVDELLALVRIQKLLARAEELAVDCPFWIEPEDDFRGRQISTQRWQIVAAAGGKGIAVHQHDRDDLSFGGAGRVLFGRAFSEENALYAGVELGASAAFPKDAMGTRTGLVIGIDVVTPLVYRHTLTNTYWELEGGFLARTNEADWSKIDPGVHAGVTFGGRALRQRWVFPGAAFGVSIERTFDDDVTLVKVGGRVTFDIDL